jgi:hypothetical protein
MALHLELGPLHTRLAGAPGAPSRMRNDEKKWKNIIGF